MNIKAIRLGLSFSHNLGSASSTVLGLIIGDCMQTVPCSIKPIRPWLPLWVQLLTDGSLSNFPWTKMWSVCSCAHTHTSLWGRVYFKTFHLIVIVFELLIFNFNNVILNISHLTTPPLPVTPRQHRVLFLRSLSLSQGQHVHTHCDSLHRSATSEFQL